MPSLLRSSVCAGLSLFASLSGVRADNNVTNLAPVPIIRSWGTSAGLPQNTVSAIAQTPDGYLWLATRDGLARFDGMRFKVFGLEHGLPNVDVNTLFTGHDGILWIGTFSSGLCRMQQDRIEVIPTPNHQPGGDTINCLAEDTAGRLWVGTSGGLRFYQKEMWLEDSTLGQLQRAPVTCLLRSRDGKTMWISSSIYGLFAYENGHLEPCIGPAGHEKIVGEALYEDRQGRLWVGIGNGMVLCRQNGLWKVYNESDGLPFAFVTTIAEDADGTVWAGSLDAGLYRFDGSHFNVVTQADGLSADDIRCLFCDPEGNLWIGTRTGGLDRLSRRKLVLIDNAQGLTNDFTRSVAQTPDGTIWVGTIGGSLYRGGLSGFAALRPADEDRVYFYASAYSLLSAPDNSLWWGAGGALMHWQNNRLADCITNLPWIQNGTITALQYDRHGGMWIGTGAGHLEHMQNGMFVEFTNQFTRATITSLAVQPDGALWVGTMANGLKLIHEGSDTAISITNGLPERASIRTLYLDASGTLWIGTAGGGLNCLREGRVTSFTASQGLTPRTVSQIVEDDWGSLWLGCSRGIFKVNKQDLLDCADHKLAFVHCRTFGVDDGMLTEECSGGFCPAGFKTQSGLICISTVKGLVFLDPTKSRDEMPPPKVLLEEALVNGQPQAYADNKNTNTAGPATSRLIVPPGTRDVELHYTAISFAAPEKIGFRYQLEHFDDGWTEANAQRTVTYHHLPPGEFVFHVQACNADGVWSDKDTLLAVTTLPFFWETTWFHGTAALVLSGITVGTLWLLLRQRYKQRLARLQTLNAIQRERLRISKDMHDHIGSVLTQVSQLSDMGLNETGDQALVKNRLERIGNRSRVAVQALDEIVWATNPKNDNLASFAEYVSRFGDEFFEFTDVRCWQEIPATLPAIPLRADIRHNVFLASREALNNALKHAQCTEVWIKIKYESGEATLEIEDNGAGFNPAETGAGGNGLDNMQIRLSECGGRTVLDSAPGKGTRVRITFPVRP